MQLQEIDEYRWSGIDEPPETRGKGKERGKKRKVLSREISEKSGSWWARGMGRPWGLRDLCLLCSKWSSTVQVPDQSALPVQVLGRAGWARWTGSKDAQGRTGQGPKADDWLDVCWTVGLEQSTGPSDGWEPSVTKQPREPGGGWALGVTV